MSGKHLAIKTINRQMKNQRTLEHQQEIVGTFALLANTLECDDRIMENIGRAPEHKLTTQELLEILQETEKLASATALTLEDYNNQFIYDNEPPANYQEIMNELENTSGWQTEMENKLNGLLAAVMVLNDEIDRNIFTNYWKPELDVMGL